MKRFLVITIVLVFTAGYALAGDLVNADPHSRIAMEGYDPVAFFTDSRATKGNPSIGAEREGYTYLFASEKHKAMFLAQPEKYLPAYGGYCAYGVSLGYLFPVDISTWEIVDGRLVFQYSPDIRKVFAEDKDGNYRKADQNWPKLVRKHG